MEETEGTTRVSCAPSGAHTEIDVDPEVRTSGYECTFFPHSGSTVAEAGVAEKYRAAVSRTCCGVSA